MESKPQCCKIKRDIPNHPQEVYKSEDLLREWKFRVQPPDLHKSETVCVIGDSTYLGSWKPSNVIPLSKEENENIWSATVQIPSDVDVLFRYCVCIVDSESRNVIVRFWETSITPRVIKISSQIPTESDIFGQIDETLKIDKGWLSAGTALQLKLFDNPLKTQVLNGDVSIKITPVDVPFTCAPEVCWVPEAERVITEVAKLNEDDVVFKPQPEFGCLYQKYDYLVFNITEANTKVRTYVIDIFSKIPESVDSPIHVGYSHILKSDLQDSKGKLKIPIMCDTNHRSIGYLSIEYIIVKPMAEALSDMKVSYASHWKDSWRGLEVGHRGMGSSFKVWEEKKLRENTVASLKKAGESGADMVEFDIQLSKDLVPVLYHDFNLCIATTKKNGDIHKEMIKMPMQNLNNLHLQELKIYHVAESNGMVFDFDEDIPRPFPTLLEVLKEIDPLVGFNIEIKWPMTNVYGKTDLDYPMDVNLYLDKIIEIVLRFGGSRKIVFSCFDPDACTAIRLKQNLYPTLFLTQGVTEKYDEIDDARCNSVPAAIRFAQGASLLGIVVHTEDLLRDPTQVQLVSDAGLVHFCWGEDNNNKDTINKLKGWGMHGIIFDKLDVYSTKPSKESIFKPTKTQ